MACMVDVTEIQEFDGSHEDPWMDLLQELGPEVLKAIHKVTNLPISEINFTRPDCNDLTSSDNQTISVLSSFLDMADSVGNYEYLITARREIDDVHSYIENYHPNVTRIHIGSNADGFRFKKAKLDVLIVPRGMHVFTDIKSLRDRMDQVPQLSPVNGKVTADLMFVMHTKDSPPGQSKLFRLSPTQLSEEEQTGTTHDSWNLHSFFPGDVFLDICERNFLADQPVYGTQCQSEYGLALYNNIFCLPCEQWPEAAKEWPFRKRFNKWPSIKTLTEVVECGCHLVPEISGTGGKALEWKIYFSTAEKVLIRSFNEFQFKTLALLRLMMSQLVHFNPGYEQILYPYVLNTTVFHVVEKMPENVWCNAYFVNGFYSCLDFLCNGIVDKFIRHYFIPSVNLFNPDTPKQVCTGVISALTTIRTKHVQLMLQKAEVFKFGMRDVPIYEDRPEILVAQGLVPSNGISVELVYDIGMLQELRVFPLSDVTIANKKYERAKKLKESDELLPDVKRGFLEYMINHLQQCRGILLLKDFMDGIWYLSSDEREKLWSTSFKAISSIVHMDVTAGRLAIATYFLMKRYYQEAIVLAEQAMEMFDWIILYLDHDEKQNMVSEEVAEYERIVCGKDIPYSTKVPACFAVNVTFAKAKTIIPKDLMFDLYFCKNPLFFSISPRVYGHFILCHCYFYLKELKPAKKHLRKLEKTLTDKQHYFKPYLNHNALGSCHRLFGNYATAMHHYWEAYRRKPDNHACLFHAVVTILIHYWKSPKTVAIYKEENQNEGDLPDKECVIL